MSDLRNVIDTALACITSPAGLPAAFSDLIAVRIFTKPNIPSGAWSHTDALMLVSEVHAYVTAKLELHYEPGINPHSMCGAAPLWKIMIARLRSPLIYWHTTPGLKRNADAPKGASVTEWDWTNGRTVWSHPECLRLEAGENANSDRLESELEHLEQCDHCYGLRVIDDERCVKKEARCICSTTSVVTDQSS